MPPADGDGPDAAPVVQSVGAVERDATALDGLAVTPRLVETLREWGVLPPS